MIKITISEEIKNVCPQFVCATLEAKFVNTPYSDKLWEEINTFRQAYLKTYTTESIKLMPSIQATRTAYKRCGKDPSRYRPSGEALVRRLLNGHELYQINTVVDLINLASISFGYSIGGFDIDKIKGTELVLGIGIFLDAPERNDTDNQKDSDHDHDNIKYIHNTHLLVFSGSLLGHNLLALDPDNFTVLNDLKEMHFPVIRLCRFPIVADLFRKQDRLIDDRSQQQNCNNDAHYDYRCFHSYVPSRYYSNIIMKRH